MNVAGPLLTLALVLGWRLRRRSRERVLGPRFLWLAPTLYMAIIAFVLSRHPPDATGWRLLALGLLIGAAAGWLRGRLFTLRLVDGGGELRLRRSRWAITMLVGIVALRFVANLWPAWASTLMVTDLMLGLVFGLIAVTRLEVAVRARALLAEAGERR
jgi:hypothetical protein